MKKLLALTVEITVLAVFALVITLSACRKDPRNPDQEKNCREDGTVTKVACGVGHYGNLWIRLDNGTYLQPCESDVNITLQEGQRVKIGYTTIKRNSCYQDKPRCEAVVPPAEKIRLTCLKVTKEPIGEELCTHKGILREHTDPGSNCFVRLIEKADGSLIEPISQKELYSVGLQVDAPVYYSYTLSNYRGTNCTNYQAVELNCIKGLK